MMDRPIDRQAPLSPQLAVRVAMLGGLALVLFGIVLFRLWFLQVLSGDQYVAQANANRVRDVPIQAPRGNIVDRDDQAIVGTRQATAVQVVPNQFPAHGPKRAREIASLATMLNVKPRDIRVRLDNKVNVPYANVTIKTDAGEPALVALSERQLQYPGVVVTPVYLRDYPLKSLAAQMLGTVGPIQKNELKFARLAGVPKTSVVGQSGLELSYDQYLRGRDGTKRVQVDSAGRPVGAQLTETAPIPGHELKLTLDLNLQKEGERALRMGIAAGQGNNPAADAGAFVALNPTNGEVYAMGSAPTYNPTVFTHPETDAQLARLFPKGQDPSQLDRVIAGLYPTGSTFKPITAMAALQSDLITPTTPFDDAGCIEVGRNHQKFCNSGKTANGELTGVADALRVSSDVFFYTLGERANPLRGELIQTWARKFGLGAPTGIDLPGEQSGLIPDAAWRLRANAAELACRKRNHGNACAISGDPSHVWTTGDNVNFAVGQGDLQATPLQMAVAYSALFNGGTVVRPHLGLAIDDNQGRLIQRIVEPAVRHIDFNPANQAAIADGLHQATSSPGGTSYDVFKDFPRVVYGKTGTAQHGANESGLDQSWFIAYAPDKKRPIVIAMTIEKGGFGAAAAAPAVRLMLSKWFGITPKFVVGTSKTL
jgi:penicillin-binding protein 2